MIRLIVVFQNASPYALTDVAPQIHPAFPANQPVMSPGGQGPLRDMDLLAIGAVLVFILIILGFRKILKRASSRPETRN